MMKHAFFRAEELCDYVGRVFASKNVPEGDAHCLARALVETSLRGVDTHGLKLVPIYLNLLAGNRCNPRPKFVFEDKTEIISHLNADFALGHVAGFAAMNKALVAAERFGFGLVMVSHSNHFGAAACYTLQAARQGAIGFAATNSDALVAAYGGKNPFFGTNPLAMAAQGDGDDLFSLDMATSQVSYSKIKLHEAQKLSLESGWANDHAGQMTLTAELAKVLLPLGGYKGAGLALGIQILTALLAGGNFDHKLNHVFAPEKQGQDDVSHLFACINIARITDPAHFKTRLSQLLNDLRSAASLSHEPLLAPGDKERACERERTRKGIPVESDLIAAIGQHSNIPFPLAIG